MSTQQWLLDALVRMEAKESTKLRWFLISEEEYRQRARYIRDARRLVEQGPEEPE